MGNNRKAVVLIGTNSEEENNSPFVLAEPVHIYRKLKDSVFNSLFKDPDYLLELYQAIHPEDKTTTKEDLKIITLETVFMPDITNDLGFNNKDRLLVLVEAQATWTTNIVLRALFYVSNTIQNYIKSTKQNLFGSKQVVIPPVELYVVYTGTKKIEKDVISLTDDFFGGVSCGIDARVKVITVTGGTDILNQYIRFCQIADEQIKAHGRSAETMRNIIQICVQNGILVDFLKQHEEEVVRMMVDMYTQEEIIHDLIAESEEKGLEEGLQKAATTMLQDGMDHLTVAKYSHLPLEKVEQLAQSLFV